jgi:hypothetical protein
VGDGSGEDRWIPTRGLQRFLIHAEAGGRISIGLRHLAGRARPLSLQYALLRPNGDALRNEAIAPGEASEFEVDAPESGTYALWVTGGTGGQAWYGVNIGNRHFAFPTRDEDGSGGRLFYTERWAPHTFYLTRTDADDAASLTATTGRNQVFTVQIGDEEPVLVDAEGRTFDLPTGEEPIRIAIDEPEELPDGTYCQGVHLSVEGAVHPYMSIAPGRRLLPQ